MKPNDGCALQKLVDSCWVPLALRYQRLTTKDLRLLARGETIAKEGGRIRRHDWRERHALALLFKR